MGQQSCSSGEKREGKEQGGRGTKYPEGLCPASWSGDSTFTLRLEDIRVRTEVFLNLT